MLIFIRYPSGSSADCTPDRSSKAEPDKRNPSTIGLRMAGASFTEIFPKYAEGDSVLLTEQANWSSGEEVLSDLHIGLQFSYRFNFHCGPL